MTNCINEKLNPEVILQYVADRIEKHPPTAAEALHLCLWDNKLDIHPSRHTIDSHIVIFRFRESDAWMGFTTLQWNRLSNKLARMIEKGELCRKHLKL